MGSDLIFDTETTGLPRRGWAPEDPRVPHVVQLAAVLVKHENDAWHEEAALDAILAWEGLEVPLPATRIHGISTERMRAKGRAPLLVMQEFDALVRRAGRIISFNLEFDEAVILAAYHRAGGTGAAYRKLERVCVMQSARPVCKLPAKNGGYKTPSLAEAHRALTGTEFDGAHTAMGDARACYAIARELTHQGAPLGYTPPPATPVVDVDLVWLDTVLKAVDEELGKLTDWENSFMADFTARREKYGAATTISDRQRAVLERIWEKVR